MKIRMAVASMAMMMALNPMTAFAENANGLASGAEATNALSSNVVTGFVGINLDPAQGDFLGVLHDQEEILAAGMEALEQMGQESEYADLAIAHVDNYVRVRSIPSTEGEVLGKIYNGAVAHVIETAGEDNDWFHVTSGNVEGYIKAEYFIYGEDAAAVIEDYVTRYAVITAQRLNVRKETSTDSKRIGYLDEGERAKLVENLGEWLKVEYSEGNTGYISAEYAEITEEFTYAISIEEERAEIARQKALEERRKQEEAAKAAAQAAQAAQNQAAQQTTQVTGAQDGGITPPAAYTTTDEMRESIVAYALQFVGNRYVNGGNSLTNGTDCSGFTKLIFAEYGYSLGRTPQSQFTSAGRGIDYSEIKKGDIICYSSNGGKSCTHVAIYIGDGMIVHAANSRKGICTQRAEYSSIYGVRNVID
ncbi:MAG: SH3 domain-containing protein [Lachnospiraceae bacterium]|nr:SH3 domain-containing protein [Lachnospiraceae bacterium]